MSRRRLLPAATLVVVLLAGLGVWLTQALERGELDATSIGVAVNGPVLTLAPGEEACQEPIGMDRAATRLGLGFADSRPPGPAVAVEVRELESDRVLAGARIPRGWTLMPYEYYGLELDGRIPAGAAVRVCGRNLGRQPLELYGSRAIQEAQVNREDGADWAVYFPLGPDDRRTYAQAAGDVVERASVLRPDIVTPIVYGVLALLLFVGGPVVLVRAVSAADDETDRP